MRNYRKTDPEESVWFLAFIVLIFVGGLWLSASIDGDTVKPVQTYATL